MSEAVLEMEDITGRLVVGIGIGTGMMTGMEGAMLLKGADAVNEAVDDAADCSAEDTASIV